MSEANTLLAKLLSKGDKVFIDNGQLVIQPNSGLPVSAGYMEEHSRTLIIDALALVGATGYEYISYSTGNYPIGNYGRHKASGITLQFSELLTSASVYACFNVDLTRKRNTAKGKKGEPLPTGQFSVGQRSHFYQFWQSTGLPIPASATRFYMRMGKLKRFVFTANMSENSRLQTDALRPLTIDYEQLLSTHNLRINFAQFPHKQRTTMTHKELPKTQSPQGITQNQTTCDQHYGNKVIREHGYKEDSTNDDRHSSMDGNVGETAQQRKERLNKWADEYIAKSRENTAQF